MIWRMIGILLVVVGLSFLAWPRRRKVRDWFKKQQGRITKKWRMLSLFVLVMSLSFLLWPRSLYHYTYSTPCYSFYDNCSQKRAKTWKLGGGFDLVCTFILGDPLVKNDGFIVSQFAPCIGQHQRYDPNRGHYYTDADFNVLIAMLGSTALGGASAIVYLGVYKRKAS